MALQDLTPQLRMRLSRMERAVGWFVLLATALLVFGFGYYLYNTANRKGWFIPHAPYFTFTDRATGLKVGDPVSLMGFDVGRITRIDTMDPWSPYNVYVEFEIKEPYNGYMWTGPNGSRAKVVTADFLGKRVLEVTKGTGGYPAYRFNPLLELDINDALAAPQPERWVFAEQFDEGTNTIAYALSPVTQQQLATLAKLGVQRVPVLETNVTRNAPTVVWDDKAGRYVTFIPKNIPDQNIKNNRYWLISDESPAITERLETLVSSVEKALPDVLALTNQLATVLSNSANLTSNFNTFALEVRPAASNLTLITEQLRGAGSLGVWLLGTNGAQKADVTLTSAASTMANVNTNLDEIFASIGLSLNNLANLTSNLNAQVQANTNILGSISKAVTDTDDLVQGLKRHWLFRSAFKTPKTNAPSSSTKEFERLTSPRDPTRQ